MRDTGVVLRPYFDERSMQRPMRTRAPVQQRLAAWTHAVRRRLAVSARDHWLAVRVVKVVLSSTAGADTTGTVTEATQPRQLVKNRIISNSTRGHLWRLLAERLTRVIPSLFAAQQGFLRRFRGCLVAYTVYAHT